MSSSELDFLISAISLPALMTSSSSLRSSACSLPQPAKLLPALPHLKKQPLSLHIFCSPTQWELTYKQPPFIHISCSQQPPAVEAPL